MAVPVSAAPRAGQLVEHDGKVFDTIREGQAYILIPPNTRTSVNPQAYAKAGDEGEKNQHVFYNPIQQFNRDLSVLSIKAFGEDLCANRRLKHERDGEKLQAKRDRKRKRKGEREEGEDAQRSGVKLRKGEDSLAAAVADELVVGGDGERKAEAGMHTNGTTQAVDDMAGDHTSQTVADTTVGEALAEAEAGDKDPASGKAVDNTATAESDGPSQAWKPKFRILDALSATGLRALRYATEIPFATSITANDMDRNATKSIRTNVEHNKLSQTITVNTANALAHMYGVAFPPTNSHGPEHISGKYDVIDLDPYGTAAPFIDSALQALSDGGLLCVTCTDSGVFASCGYCEKTFSLYGGMPVKGPHSHEGGLRLIIQSIASTAAKYGLAIEPLLSLSIDFYVRVFIRVVRSPADVKFLAGKTMVVYECDAGCGAWYTQTLGRNVRQTGKKQIKGQENNPTFNFKHTIAQAPGTDRLCEHCNSKMHVAGPMWAGPLHNAAFVSKVLSDAISADREVYHTVPRIEGMLNTALEELMVVHGADDAWNAAERGDGSREILPKTPPEVVDAHPFFFMPSALSKVVHCIAPPEAAVKGALRHAGYRATRSHCKPGSIKTDAPWAAIWEIMREWVRQKQPIKEGALREGSAGWHIMQAARKPDRDSKEGALADELAEVDSPDIVTEQRAAPVTAPPTDPKRITVVFDEALGKDKAGRRLVRYQQNPRENWGPMSRAKGSG